MEAVERGGITHEDDIEACWTPLEGLQSYQPVLGLLKVPLVLLHVRCQKHHVDGVILNGVSSADLEYPYYLPQPRASLVSAVG